MVASLRYLDCFVKIDGIWLFAERPLYVDWVEERALSASTLDYAFRRLQQYRHLTDIADLTNGRFAPIVLKTRKSRGSKKPANVAHWRFQPLQGSVESIRESAIVFAVIDVVPHLAANSSDAQARAWSPRSM